MAGNQVLEWFDIDSEIKTADLKDVCTHTSLLKLNGTDAICRILSLLPICECPQ